MLESHNDAFKGLSIYTKGLYDPSGGVSAPMLGLEYKDKNITNTTMFTTYPWSKIGCEQRLLAKVADGVNVGVGADFDYEKDNKAGAL